MDKISDNNLFDLPLERADKIEDLPFGLIVNEPIEPELLQVHCQMHRNAAWDFPGAHEVLFVDTDPETGEEIWDETKVALGQQINRQIGQAEKWRAIMGWPPRSRDPTPADALAYMAWADASAGSALFYTLEAKKTKLAKRAIR